MPESTCVIQECEAHHTQEYAFKCYEKSMKETFAEEGDSGSIVYCAGGDHDTKIVAMIFAADIKTGLAWATPIHDIIEDVLERFGKIPIPDN